MYGKDANMAEVAVNSSEKLNAIIVAAD